ncbi:MAG: hypothetical protein NC133_04255 [Prevotella sp.]|nr:hypothetical protein [Prevotella sp.]
MEQEIILTGEKAVALQTKLAEILDRVNQNQKLVKCAVARDKFYKAEHYVNARRCRQIGADLTMTKEVAVCTTPNFTVAPDGAVAEKYPANVMEEAEFFFRDHDKTVGQIVVKRDRVHNQKHETQIYENVAVISSAWNINHPTAVTRTETVSTQNNVTKTTNVDVFHAQNETADKVLDRLATAITQSYAHAAAQKLRKCNLTERVTLKQREINLDQPDRTRD